MLLLVLILVVVAFALLVVALLTGSVLSAWLAVGVSVLAGIVLVVDWFQRRAAVKAGPLSESEQVVTPRADIDPVTQVFAVQSVGSAGASGFSAGDRPTTATPFDHESDSQQTMILPAIRPSGSESRPSGSLPGITPSEAFSSPGVTTPAGEPAPHEMPEVRTSLPDEDPSGVEQTVVVGVRRPKTQDDPDVPGAGSTTGGSAVDEDALASVAAPAVPAPPTPDVAVPDTTRTHTGLPGYAGPTNGVSGAASRDVLPGAAAVENAAGPATTPAGTDDEPVDVVTAPPDAAEDPDEPRRADSAGERSPGAAGPDGVEPAPSGPGGGDLWSRLTAGAVVAGSTVKDLPAVRPTGTGGGPDPGTVPAADPPERGALNGMARAMPPPADDSPAHAAPAPVGVGGPDGGLPVEVARSSAVDGTDPPLRPGTATPPDGSAYPGTAAASIGADASGLGSHADTAFVAPADPATSNTGAVGNTGATGATDVQEPMATGPSVPVVHDAVDRSTAGSPPPAMADVEPPEEADTAAAHSVSGLEDEVLVIDEKPRYHLAGCRAVLAEAVIPLPAREAVDLGFTPCGWCAPDAALADRHRADVGR